MPFPAIISGKEEAMESMNISLPEPLRQFVEGQIASGRYSSASEYIRELIREDEKRKAEQRLEALLLEGLQGEEAELTPGDWAAIRREARARLAMGMKRR
jgi:antitoxin ParD1/3/4